MDRDRLNSMENVALALNRRSQFKAETRFICEAGANTPAAPDMTITVPAGLNKAAHSRAVLKALQDFPPDLVEYHQQLGCAAEFAKRLPSVKHVLYRHTRIRPPRHLIDRMRYRARLRAFDRLIFVSRAARTEFLADYPAFDARVRVYALRAEPMAELATWLAEAEQLWTEQLLALKTHMETAADHEDDQ